MSFFMLTPIDKFARLCYNAGMTDKRYATIRILEATRQNLRIIAALLNEPMLVLIDRLANRELQDLNSQRNKNSHTSHTHGPLEGRKSSDG